MNKKYLAGILSLLLMITSGSSRIYAEENPAGENDPEETEELQEESITDTEEVPSDESAEEAAGPEDTLTEDAVSEEEAEEETDTENTAETEEEISEEAEDAALPMLSGETPASDFTYTISGGTAAITAYTGNSAVVTVPSKISGAVVVSVENSTFSECAGLTEVTLPDTIQKIGQYAFWDCPDLSKIIILSADAGMGNRSFYECPKLKSAGPLGSGANIEYSWTDIPANAFAGCSSLETVTFPNGAKAIGNNAFNGCKKLKDVSFPSSLERIGDFAFSECAALTKVELPESTVSVGARAFLNCAGLKTAELPSVTAIGMNAFEKCTGLQEVNASSAETINNNAFLGSSSLKTIWLTNTLKRVNLSAFRNCSVLSKVYFFGSKRQFSAITFGNYNDALKNAELICAAPDKITFEEGNALEMEKGGTVTLHPVYESEHTDAVFEYVEWVSDNEAAASVDQNGKVTVKDFGKAVIKAYSIIDNEIAAVCTITVPFRAITKITFADSSMTIPTKENVKLNPVITPADADNGVVWTSDNEKIAVVDDNGVVTALTYGTAKITAASDQNPAIKAVITIQTRFFDVNDSSQSYYKPVYWGADNGVVAGFNGGEYFGPDEDCTRAQFVTFLWRLAGRPTGTKDVSFPDVDPGANYFRAVKWAVSEGIIVGFKHDNAPATFEPDGVVTRGQVATMLWRYGGRKTPKTGAAFSDVKASDNIFRAVSWGQEVGIIKGYKTGEFAGQFRPNDSCLRQHIVTFLYRYARDVMKKKM